MRAYLVIGFLIVFSSPAVAYIGPGAGLGVVAGTLAFIFGFIFLVIAVIWFPLKRWFKGAKRKRSKRKEISKND